MVPITVVAFDFARISLMITHPLNFEFNFYDGFGLAITGVGVWMINFFPEKKQKACIDEDF
jgi:hypothetical protein